MQSVKIKSSTVQHSMYLAISPDSLNPHLLYLALIFVYCNDIHLHKQQKLVLSQKKTYVKLSMHHKHLDVRFDSCKIENEYLDSVISPTWLVHIYIILDIYLISS